MRIVIALADDAMQKRGAGAGTSKEAETLRAAAEQLARVADGNDLVVVQAQGHPLWPAPEYDRGAYAMNGFAHDLLATDADHTIACRLDMELRHRLPSTRACATLFSMVEVDMADPAFDHPDMPIGAVFTGQRALACAQQKHWRIAHDGVGYRRVVPSPRPKRLLQLAALRGFVDQGAVVMCTVGSIPVVLSAADGGWHGVEAVIDPYVGAAFVAQEIGADRFVIATDVAGVFLDWGTANSKLLRHGHPSAVREFAAEAGSMGPKLQAASGFAERTGARAVIGALDDVARLVDGTAGTTISCERVDPRRFAGGAVAR